MGFSVASGEEQQACGQVCPFPGAPTCSGCSFWLSCGDGAAVAVGGLSAFPARSSVLCCRNAIMTLPICVIKGMKTSWFFCLFVLNHSALS